MFSSIQLQVNKNFFHRSSFYLSNFIHQSWLKKTEGKVQAWDWLWYPMLWSPKVEHWVCIENIKTGILIWPSNRQVPFDMGSKKVQKCLKIFHVLRCPQRAKVSEKL